MIDLDPCQIKCFFLRNDYFMTREFGAKVIEYNTISVAFLAASQVVSEELGGEKCAGLNNMVSFLQDACRLHADYYKVSLQRRGDCVF